MRKNIINSSKNNSKLKIILDDLSGPEIRELLIEHMQEMHQHSPAESIHALDLESLKQADVAFWTIWESEELLGCGALKMLSENHAEIKSMRVAYRHKGKGVANNLVEHLLAEAVEHGYKRLSLETGAMEGFSRARALYQKYGFTDCKPFADYTDDPNSVYMTKLL